MPSISVVVLKHSSQNQSMQTNTQLLEKYKAVRQMTEELCNPLQTEDYVVQPIDFVSPPKWNIAHVTWFFETFILKPLKKNYESFNSDFDFFFNSYYESLGKRTLRTQRGNMTRPTTGEVYAYREYVDEAMQEFLEELPAVSAHFEAVFELGLNHEQQHQELLLTDLKYILANNPLFPTYLLNKKTSLEKVSLQENYLQIDADLYQVGYQGDEFYFDNEKGVHQVYLHKFKISNKLITNAEYLEFMEAGGYTQFKYWLSAGWEWVKTNQIASPLYWHNLEGVWHYYTLSGLKKVDLYEPVTHISLYEADAFARWKGKRLPTEFEWEVACKLHTNSVGQGANLLEERNFHPIQQINTNFLGNVWEWTNSAYLPYPYYKQAEGALGEYNGKFMMNQMVLRGGSCATPQNHIRVTYRNFFYPQERWQFTGIRLAEHI